MNDVDSEINSVEDLQERNADLEEDLKRLEQQIYKLETNYLDEAWSYGTALRGFEGYLSSRIRATSTPKKKPFKDSDRIFSNSSATSEKAIKELNEDTNGFQEELIEEGDEELFDDQYIIQPNGQKRKRNANGQFLRRKK
eukprot:gene4034-7323_t